MALPESAPEELRILEQLQNKCLEKMKSKDAPLNEKKVAMDNFKEIQQLKKAYMDAWGQQTGDALKKASEELSRQAAKFGLQWPR